MSRGPGFIKSIEFYNINIEPISGFQPVAFDESTIAWGVALGWVIPNFLSGGVHNNACNPCILHKLELNILFNQVSFHGFANAQCVDIACVISDF